MEGMGPMISGNLVLNKGAKSHRILILEDEVVLDYYAFPFGRAFLLLGHTQQTPKYR
jgi:hypothetical protein